MNRMEEYGALLAELEKTPPELADTVERGRRRCRRSRVLRRWGVSAASFAGAAAAFVLLVNVSIPFARACGNIPLLRELAAAVAFSPSLKAAVEHDYVQAIAQKQTVNGVTMSVEYVVVDRKQVNIFYTLEDESGRELEGEPEILERSGAHVKAGVSWEFSPGEKGLRQITVDFVADDVPDTLILRYDVHLAPGHGGADEAPAAVLPQGQDKAPGERAAVLASFEFTLRFDTSYTASGTVYELNRPIVLDGQKITVTTVEVYPTHLRLNLADDPDNTAWLVGLNFYLEDGEGRRYDKIAGGITATGSENSPFMASHRLESTYFAGAEHLTIRITGATWLDKDREYLKVDVPSGRAVSPAPDGVELGRVWRSGDNVNVILLAKAGEDGGSHGVLYDGWRDETGGKHEVDRRESSSAQEKAQEQEGIIVPAGYFYERFTLRDCPWDTVELSMGFSRKESFDAVLDVPVK